MRPVENVVKLTKAECSQLLHLTKKGKATPREVKRARILLLSHEGYADAEIVLRVEVSIEMCKQIRKRFQTERLELIKDKPRTGRPNRNAPQRPQRMGQAWSSSNADQFANFDFVYFL
jgi:hypothetical protein